MSTVNTYIIENELLVNNIRVICNEMNSCKIRGVVKGDGYGLGILPFANVLKNGGIKSFAVTMPEDAMTLNNNGFENDVLMMRSTDADRELDLLLNAGAILTIGSERSWNAALKACERNSVSARAHLYFDCGMCREGFDLRKPEMVLPLLNNVGRIKITGIYTHFPRAGGPENNTKNKFSQFIKAYEELNAAGWSGEVHCANSITALRFPEMRLDSVRIGSAFLGRVGYDGEAANGLRPVGHLECGICEIRTVNKGESIGYGGIWTAKRNSRIAVLDAGYFEGINTEFGREMYSLRDYFRASLSPIKRMIHKRSLYAIVNGFKVPVVGRVAMQQTMLDVTDISCNVHDIAVLPCNPLLVRNVIREYR